MKVYILNFVVYLMAMIGVIYVSLMVFKKTIGQNNLKSDKSLIKVEGSLNIAPRKTLHVINVEGEKFLIASDIQNTTFLAKLDDHKKESKIEKTPKIKPHDKMFMDELDELKISKLAKNVSVFDEMEKEKSVFRELIEKL